MKAERFIYFARDEVSGLIKLGVSCAPTRRLRQHERASLLGGRRRMTLLLAVRYDDAFAVENILLQKRFKHLQVRGEWLEPGPDLLSFIQASA